MKALLLSRYKHLEIADLPDPTPRQGEVLVSVAACGICGSDVHGYDGSSGRRIPPIVMGHEAAGTEQNKVLYENKEWVEYLCDRIPLKRPGQPQDLDAAVVFLAAESSRYITGQTLLVDGGISTGATRALVEPAKAAPSQPRESP